MKKGPPVHTGYEREGNGGVVIQSLSKVKTGVVYTTKWMFGNPQAMEFMHQHDIREGSTTNAFQRGRDSMIIGMNNMRLAIGSEVAERIKA